MIAVCVGEIPNTWIFFSGKNLERIRPLLKKADAAKLEGNGYPMNITISGEVVVAQDNNGKVNFLFLENPLIELENRGSHRSQDQNRTLRGLERFIAWAMLRRKPTDRECEFIHEAVLEGAAPQITSPVTGHVMFKRTSMMDTKELALCVEYAMVMLGQMDISPDVMAAIGGDMVNLWQAWYSWRYKDDDPLFEHEQGMTWDRYCESRPVCEVCGTGGSQYDPLERMHIVSAGSDVRDYEEPWNWLRAHRSCHSRQHQNGWDQILNEHPHIKSKVEKARVLAGKKGVNES